MSCDDNKKLVRQFTEEFNEAMADVAKIRALYEKFLAPNYVGHSLLRGDTNSEQRIQSAVMTDQLYRI